MILTFEERHSALWIKLKQHCEDRLQVLRAKNDGMLDEVTTAHLRGQIFAMKNLAALDTDQPTVVDE